MQREITAQDELETAFRIEARYGNPVKWALLLVSPLIVAGVRQSLFGSEGGWSIEASVLLGYAACNLLFTLAFIPPPMLTRWRLPVLPVTIRRALLSASYLVDYFYVSGLVGLTGGFQSDLYILYALLALKSAIYYPYVRELVVTTFFSGALWVLVAYVQANSLFFLADGGFIGRYVALYGLIVGSLLISWIMERRQRAIHALGENLTRKGEDLEAQAYIVQRTAADLANRLLELRSLQESVKAINSALALDELLQRIVENATQVLRGARCTIALVDEKAECVITSAASGIPKEELSGTCFRIGEGVAGWVVANREPALIHAVDEDSRFRPTGGRPIVSLVSVPLISENSVVGALTATSPEPHAFTEADVNLLDAFGDQAVIAVKNARLYEQLVQEEKETARLYQSVLEKSNELEAVLRGIGDGVLFVDADLHLLMMNPVAARIFGVSQTPRQGVRLPEIVDSEALIASIRETLAEEEGSLIREITLDRDEQRKAVYQALSSTVRGASAEIRGVVTVLRDITTQKEIDQIKSDFLSVVSHELRTPLHSIKGFVDIILMGKTGEINELQRDFL
ncbi:MAG: GAF domain-containing protein, partial [Chloroflexi bacterium]|nr:GAF domain-containing protein [Chloroflexota bacterium]